MSQDPRFKAEHDTRMEGVCLDLIASLIRQRDRIEDLRAGVELHLEARQFAAEHPTDPLRRDVEQMRQIADTLHAAANWIDQPSNVPHTFSGRDRCPRCKRIHANDLVPEQELPRGMAL